MVYIKSTKPSIIKSKSILFLIHASGFVLLVLFAFLLNSKFSSRNKSEPILSPVINKQQIINPVRYEVNSTHLWSIRLADENYFNLSDRLPCRTVKYRRGQKTEIINSCDHSPTNEYSIQNTFEAQKWLFEHQHPRDCSNKRFAIIRTFANTGIGSTIHQLAWTFGKAIAQDRIVLYDTPGNWVK